MIYNLVLTMKNINYKMLINTYLFTIIINNIQNKAI